MPSKSNDRLFWADRKNRMEKTRLDMMIRKFDREKITYTHEIEREKRAVVKNLGFVRRTTGASDQGRPPINDDDEDFKNAPNYRMGIRLSERRLLEWRDSEKQLEKSRAHTEYELLKSMGKYRKYTIDDNGYGPNGFTTNGRATRSAPSLGMDIGRVSRNTIVDDDVFYDGMNSPRFNRTESMVKLNAEELEKQIIGDYKSMFHNTQIPPTSQFTKSKRHGYIINNTKDDENRRNGLRPHTVMGNQSKRKSFSGSEKRPATAQANYPASQCDKNKQRKPSKPKQPEVPTSPLMNNFMAKTSGNGHIDITENDIVNGGLDIIDGIQNEPQKFSYSKVKHSSSEYLDSADVDLKVDTKRKQFVDFDCNSCEPSYNNDLNTTIIYGDDSENPIIFQGINPKQSNDSKNTDSLQETTTGYSEPNLIPVESADSNIETLSEKNQTNRTHSETDQSEATQTLTDTGGEVPSENEAQMDASAKANGRMKKSPRSKPPRRLVTLSGISEDKMLSIESQNDETASQATMTTTSRMTPSRQRRTSTASSMSSDKFSVLYGSVSDISFASDGQPKPSNWREIVAAESSPIPDTTKFTNVTTVVRAALAFSKTARKRALDKLVEEQSADPRELIRQERIRRLQSRNSVLMSISEQWTSNENGRPGSVMTQHDE